MYKRQYERRIDKINAVLNSYGISSIEEAEKITKDAGLDIRQTAHRQLGTYLGIPQKYYELMRTDAPELLAYNANYWFSQKNELRTLRTMDGCARAFLSLSLIHI